MIPLLLSLVLGSDAAADFQSYRAHIAAASASLAEGDIGRTRAWLEKAPNRYRGWEWDYLRGETDASIAEFKAGSSAISRLQVSPDGTLLAAAHADGTISLWNPRNYGRVGDLRGHTGAVFGLQFSADGKTLVSTSRDNSIRLWDVASRQSLGALGEHPVTPYDCALSPDGKRAVSVGWRMSPDTKRPVGLIRVWDVATRKMLSTQDYSTHPVSCVTFGVDANKAYIGTWEYPVLEFDLAAQTIIRQLWPKETAGYKAIDWVAIDPLRPRILTATKDKTAKLIDLVSGVETAALEHGGHVGVARFSRNGKWIVTASQDGAVRLFDAETAHPVARLLGHGFAVTALALLPDGSRAFSSDPSGTIKVWELSRPGAYAPKFTNKGGWSCVFSPDGSKLAIGTNDATVQIRDAGSLAIVSTSSPFGALVVDTAWSPAGDAVVGGSNDGTIRCFDLDGMRHRWTFQGQGQMRATDWSPDGKFVIAGAGRSGLVHLVDAKSGAQVAEFAMAPGTLGVAFAPDSKWAACGSAQRLVALDLNSKKPRWSVETASSAIIEVAVSPDGRTIAVGEEGGQVELFRARDGKKLWSASASGSQWGVHFSPDGKRVASTGYDFAVHFWDPATGLEVFALRNLPIQGFDARFSRDGHRLAFMGGSGETWIVDRRPFKQRGTQSP